MNVSADEHVDASVLRLVVEESLEEVLADPRVALAGERRDVHERDAELRALPHLGLLHRADPVGLLVEIRQVLLLLQLLLRLPQRVDQDEERRTLPERIVRLAVGLRKVVAVLVGVDAPDIVVAADEQRGLGRSPLAHHVVQIAERDVVANVVPDVILDIVAVEEIEVRVVGSAVVDHRIKDEARTAVEVGRHEHLVVVTLRVDGLERVDLTTDGLDHMVGGRVVVAVRKQPILVLGRRLEARQGIALDLARVVDLSVLDRPARRPLLRALLAVLDAARARDARNPGDGHRRLRGQRQPRSVQRHREVHLVAHVVPRLGIIHAHRRLLPAEIVVVDLGIGLHGRTGRDQRRRKRTLLHHVHVLIIFPWFARNSNASRPQERSRRRSPPSPP